MKALIREDIFRALEAAKKTPALRKQDGTIRRFDVDGCILYVVPFRRWAWHKRERLSAEFRRQHCSP